MSSHLPYGLRCTAILPTLGGVAVAGCGHTAGAAFVYAVALNPADQPDRKATGFGAPSRERFGFSR